MPSAKRPNRTWLEASAPIQVPSTTLTSETTAPAERSKPPVRMTMVWPIAASASVAPPDDMKLSSK